MPAKYSSELVKAVQSADACGLGQRLASVCIDADLPAVYVAQVLGVSRMALHTWFRGGAIRERKYPIIEAFIRLVREDLNKGVLPVKTLREARAYLQEMCDEPIKTVTEQTNG